VKGALKLATVKGIAIYLHWTFALIIVYVAFVYATAGGGPLDVLKGIALILVVFFCVVLHELGHALTAMRFGVRTKDIVLLPIGGVARLESMPDDPKQELLVAIAGPAVNVVIAILLFPLAYALGDFAQFGQMMEQVQSAQQANGNGGGAGQSGQIHPADIPFVLNLLVVNILLVVFNAIPAFPMDGGRVLRSILAMSMDYVKATRAAARAGQFIAVLFAILALVSFNPILFIIALFVFLGATGEASMAAERVAVAGLRVRDAMMTRFLTLDAEEHISEAAEELLAGDQQDFPVLQGGQLIGVLTRHELINAIAHGDDAGPVSDHAVRSCDPVREDDSLEKTLRSMREQNCPTLPVVRDDQLIGLLTLENVTELILLTQARRTHQTPASA